MTTTTNHFERGNDFYASGDFDAAVEAYRLGLDDDNLDKALIHNNLGLALCQTGRCEEGLAQFFEALALVPDDPDLLNNVGEALVELGRSGEAISILTRASQMCPDDAEIHAALGRAYSREGHYAEALAQFTRAVELDPSDIESAEIIRRMNLLSDQMATIAGPETDAWSFAPPLEPLRAIGQDEGPATAPDRIAEDLNTDAILAQRQAAERAEREAAERAAREAAERAEREAAERAAQEAAERAAQEAAERAEREAAERAEREAAERAQREAAERAEREAAERAEREAAERAEREAAERAGREAAERAAREAAERAEREAAERAEREAAERAAQEAAERAEREAAERAAQEAAERAAQEAAERAEREAAERAAREAAERAAREAAERAAREAAERAEREAAERAAQEAAEREALEAEQIAKPSAKIEAITGDVEELGASQSINPIMSDDLIEIDPQAINVESAPPSEQDKVDIIRPSQMHLVPIDARVVPVWEPVIEIVIEPSQQAAQVSRHKHLFPRSVLRAVATLTSKRTQGSTHHTVQLLWRVAGLVALFVGVLLLLLYLTGSLNEYLPEDMRMSNAQQAVRVQIARNAPDRGATSRRTFSANGFPSNSNYPAQSESAEIPGRNGPV